MNSKSNERPGKTNAAGGGPSETLPFTRMVSVEHVPETGLDIAIEADAAERSGLAARDGLIEIGKFEAVFHLTHRSHRRLNVRGRVTGLVTQSCVVSLEPFDSMVEENVDVDFVPAEALAKANDDKAVSQAKSTLEDEEEDPPDPIIDGKIDLGALASEFLALALDPYPRKPGVEFKEVVMETPEERVSPFAVLRKLDKSS